MSTGKSSQKRRTRSTTKKVSRPRRCVKKVATETSLSRNKQPSVKKKRKLPTTTTTMSKKVTRKKKSSIPTTTKVARIQTPAVKAKKEPVTISDYQEITIKQEPMLENVASNSYDGEISSTQLFKKGSKMCPITLKATGYMNDDYLLQKDICVPKGTSVFSLVPSERPLSCLFSELM